LNTSAQLLLFLSTKRNKDIYAEEEKEKYKWGKDRDQKYRRSVNLRTNSFHKIFFDKPRAISVIHS